MKQIILVALVLLNLLYPGLMRQRTSSSIRACTAENLPLWDTLIKSSITRTPFRTASTPAVARKKNMSGRAKAITRGSGVLRLISELCPELLKAYRDVFVRHLDGENNILKWNAILVIGNLVSTDTQGWFEKMFDRYFAPIAAPS